jgi:hypothetical protein
MTNAHLQERPSFTKKALTVLSAVTGDSAVKAVAVLEKKLKNRNRQIKDLRREIYRLEMLNWGLRTKLEEGKTDDFIHIATIRTDEAIDEQLSIEQY